jgi:hypothetical protein
MQISFISENKCIEEENNSNEQCSRLCEQIAINDVGLPFAVFHYNNGTKPSLRLQLSMHRTLCTTLKCKRKMLS